jgi:hypothetical protein
LARLVLFRGLGPDLYSLAPKLLAKTDLQPLNERLDSSSIQSLVNSASPTPGRKDLFSQLWLLFNDLVERLSEDQAWRSSFFQQSSRPRFMYAPETRKRLLKNLEQYDKTCANRRLNLVWSEHFDSSKGIFKAITESTRALK